MERFWKVNATLQRKSIDLGTAGALFDSLKSYVNQLRNKFDEYASASEKLANTELDKRANAYTGVEHKFGLLLKLETLEDNVIKSKCKDLVELYKDDLEECFLDECVQFKFYLKSENSERKRENENKTNRNHRSRLFSN
ncbi:hypothetical protein J6590_006677 [Homalodisca vitripennis]|nr:hypothetical protein J6590_006677 [Homalodisca vitripennis]